MQPDDPLRRAVAALSVAAALTSILPAPALAAPAPAPEDDKGDKADADADADKAAGALAIDPSRWESLADVVVSATPTKLLVGWIDPDWPYTDGHAPDGHLTAVDLDDGSGTSATGSLDTRYFRPEAEAALWECVSARLRSMDLGVRLELIDDAVRACMKDVWRGLGDPCVDPDVEPAVCTSLDYHQSWCGRRHTPAKLEGWVCTDKLEGAFAGWAQDPASPPVTDLAIPLTTETADGTAAHFVETARGYRLHDPSDYYEWDDHVPFDSLEFQLRRGLSAPGTAGGASGGTTITLPTVALNARPALPRLADRPEYRANGGAIASCAEYAVESFYDFVVLDDWERAHAPTDAEIVAAAYDGNAAVSAMMTAAGDFDVRDKAGALVCTPGSATAPCDLDHGHPIGAGRDSALFRQPGGAVTTFQNVFVYAAHALAVDAAPAPDQASIDARTAAREAAAAHYVVDDRWHQTMRQALAAYHPDHLEDLRVKQREVWGVYWLYERARSAVEHYTVAPRCEVIATLPPPGPGMPPSFFTLSNCFSQPRMDAAIQHLAQARAEVEAAIADASLYGCTPSRPGEVTPCDWAPSIAAEAIHRRFEDPLEASWRRCVAEVGELPLVEAAAPGTPAGAVFELERVFIDPATVMTPVAGAATCPLFGATAPTRTLTYRELARCRADLIAVPWLASRANLERYWRDRDRYTRALVRALGEELAGRRLRGGGSHAKSAGNEFFGMTLQAIEADHGLASPAMSICDRDLRARGASTVDVALFQESPRGQDAAQEYDLGKEVSLAWDNPGLVRAEYEPQRGWQVEEATRWNEDLVPLSYSREVKGNLVIGEEGIGVRGSVPIPVGSWRFGVHLSQRVPLGPVDAVINLGAGLRASFGLSLGATLRRSFGPADAQCDGVEASIDAGVSASVAADGFVSVGVAAAIFEVGIRGTLTLVDFTLSTAVTTGLRTEVEDGEASPRLFADADVDLTLTTMSGSLSVYFAINLFVVSITVVELVLFSWRGPSLRQRLLDWEESDLDFCLVESVSSVLPFLTPDRLHTTTSPHGDPKPDPNCPCMPWEDEPECQQGYTPTCGDGVLNPREECDGTPGCAADCTVGGP